MREHIYVTTSGMFSIDPLLCAVHALGADRVMFSVDYPYESADEAAEFIDNAAIDGPTRSAICRGNAERVLHLR